MTGLGGGKPSNYDGPPLTKNEREKLNRMLSAPTPKFLVFLQAGLIMFGFYVLAFSFMLLFGIMESI